MAAVHLASPIDENGVVRCYKHGLEAALLTSHTSANPNRQFYRCPKDRNDNDNCNFFCWADQLHREQNLPSPPMSLPPTTPSQSQGQSTHQPGSYIPTTPRKRPFDSTFPLTPSEPTPSQKRKKMIEEALAEQSTPTQSKTQTQAVHSTLKQEEEKYDDSDDDAKWTFLTPPSSLPKPKTRPGESIQKGGPEAPGSRRPLLADTGDPFIVRSPQDSQVAIGSSTTYDIPGKGTELSPDAISTLLSALYGIPDYARKLERKKIAAEQSSDVKAKRIAELEAEVQRLKERNSALENGLRLLASTRD